MRRIRVRRIARSRCASEKDSRIEAVSLALPHHMHKDAAVLAAQAGKHALVEKPIALALSDADAMIQAAREAGTILMVAEDMHYRPAICAARRMIDAGDVGEPLYLMAHGGGSMRPRGWKGRSRTYGRRHPDGYGRPLCASYAPAHG